MKKQSFAAPDFRHNISGTASDTNAVTFFQALHQNQKQFSSICYVIFAVAWHLTCSISKSNDFIFLRVSHCNSEVVCESGFGINSCWFFDLWLIFCFVLIHYLWPLLFSYNSMCEKPYLHMIFLTVVHVEWEDHLVHPFDSHVQHILCNNTENSSENLLIFTFTHFYVM